jgi:hypothetical protein
MVDQRTISLIQYGDQEEAYIWTLPLPILMGRAKHNQIILDHAQMSRKHARIILREDAILVEDLGSVNGVRVNGHKITVAQLQDGDRVKVGPFVFQFSSQPLPPSEPVVQCPHCRRAYLKRHLDCGWCGFSLANAATLPYLAIDRHP